MAYLDGNRIQSLTPQNENRGKLNIQLPEPETEYLADLIFWMKEEEKRKRRRIQSLSPQIGKRGKLLEWMRSVASKLRLADATFHLAAKLLDFFMDGHDIMDPQLYLVSLGGILLASKMEEKDGNIPDFNKLNACVNNYFPLKDFECIEIVMLNYFDWSINLPTAHTFSMAMLPYAILNTDSLSSGMIVSFSKAHAYLEECVHYFLRVIVSDQRFIDKLPSVMGVAIIAASRRAFGIVETWPVMLENLSGLSWAELSPTVHRLLLLLRNSTPTPCDEGYVSCSGSPSGNNSQFSISDV